MAAPTADLEKDASFDEISLDHVEMPAESKISMQKRMLMSFTILAFLIILTVVITLVITRGSNPPTLEFFPHSIDDEQRIRRMVDEINGLGEPWKAEYNPMAAIKERPKLDDSDRDIDFSELKLEGLSIEESRKMQVLQDTEKHLIELASHSIVLPTKFDARETWSQCSSVHLIQDQGGCGACWATAATGPMSDRLCIASNYTDQRILSSMDLVSCCKFCGGCVGSIQVHPWIYWKKYGIVSGGSFGSNEGCKPYTISSSCGNPCPPFFAQARFNPKCERKCQSAFPGGYEKDLAKGSSIYYVKMARSYFFYPITTNAWIKHEQIMKALNISSIELIKRELFLHGPTAMGIVVSEPFMHYKSGIYTEVVTTTPQSKVLFYGHAMKLLGWGEEGGEQYWIVANSWGRKWGENGFGRISFNNMPEYMAVTAGLW